jgi:CubicO group peptidase (beta-lactamase class C family)
MIPEIGAANDRRGDAKQIELSDGRTIRGYVDAGYGGVMDAFVANFLERRDVGAACATFVGGRLVVDLWGGLADARVGRPWAADTPAVIFSCSKGVLAICAYLLVQDGRLDLDAPVARYWPAFGEHGKADITVRDAMSHRAGLPALDIDLTKDAVIGWDPVIHALEEQRPLFASKDGHFYHAMTYGWILGELIRRITGSTPGRYFRSAVGDRLGLRTWIGLPDTERGTVAWMEPPLPDEDSPAAVETARIALGSPVIERSLTMGGAFPFPADGRFVTFNDPAIQAAEIPAANGISTSRSLAHLYAACVSSVASGPPLLTRASIDDATQVRSSGPQLSGIPDDGARWGTGFQLASPPTQPMISSSSFGHAGAGGQLGFADAERQVGFAYLSNQMGGYGDVRARELSNAVRTVVGG